MNFPPFTNLATERLFLRKLSSEDAAEIFRLRKDEVVNEFLDRPRAVTIDDARSFIEKILVIFENKEGIMWAINSIDNPGLMGTVCYYNLENDKAELGYELLPEYQGKGMMTEVLQKVISFGFEELQLKTIAASPKAGNLRSISLLKKLGFIKSGETIDGYLIFKLKAYA